MIKSGLLLSAGNISVALFGLVRNVLIARLLSVEDFGIASTFAITMALVEMTSNIALDRLIVQAKDGDDPTLQSTLHTIQFARGVFGAVLLLLLASPIAELFGIPEVAWAYQMLAIVPFLRGIAHLDMFRLQREMNFVPSVAVETSAQGLSTLVAIPLALWFNDYRAMLFAILLQQLIFSLMSHIVANRSYKLSWDADIVRRVIHFGWPLLINSLLLFAIYQGDRVIIGAGIGMAELGWFSAAFTLTFVPSIVITKTLQSFFLPQLSKSQMEAEQFDNLCKVAIQAALVSGLLLAIGFAIFGGTAMILLYGTKYNAALSVLVWLAVRQAVWVARAGPTIIAMSKAQTKIPLYANIVRSVMVLFAWACVETGVGGVKMVVVLAVLGEVLAFIWSWILVRKRILRLSQDQVLICLTAATTLAFVFASTLLASEFLVVLMVVVLAMFLVVILLSRELRDWLKLQKMEFFRTQDKNNKTVQ